MREEIDIIAPLLLLLGKGRSSGVTVEFDENGREVSVHYGRTESDLEALRSAEEKRERRRAKRQRSG